MKTISPSLMARIANEANLQAAWKRVRANHGGPGTDAVSLTTFAENLDAHLDDLAHRLHNETYVPLPLRRASLPKRDGGTRDLHIPAVADRVAQRAFLNILEPLWEARFLPCSLGYRPGVGVADAVERVLAYRNAGLDWIVDADVSDFFPSVDHALLMERVRDHVSPTRDGAVLRVIGLWLEAGAMDAPPFATPPLLQSAAAQIVRAAQALQEASSEPDDDWHDPDASAAAGAGREVGRLARQFGTEAARLAWQHRRLLVPLLASKGAVIGGALGVGVVGVAALGVAFATVAKRAQNGTGGSRRVGTPQGGPISPLLSNIYLHPFDTAITRAGLRLVRYADDFVICCPSEGRAKQARETAERELHKLRLHLHPTKTRIVPCGDLLHFLGHEFDRDGAFCLSGTDTALERTPHAAIAATSHEAKRIATKTVGLVRREGAALVRDLQERRAELPPLSRTKKK